MHHGTGEADDRKRRLERHLRKVDDAVLEALGRSGPLVVVGTSATVAAYQRLTHHPWTIGLALGSPAELTEDELRLGVAEVAQAARANAADRAVARYASLAGTGRATADGDELAAAAAVGRVDTLLVGSTLTAPVDDGIRLAWEHADDVAANQVVVAACRHGASIVHVDQVRQPAMPALAGILRY